MNQKVTTITLQRSYSLRQHQWVDAGNKIFCKTCGYQVISNIDESIHFPLQKKIYLNKTKLFLEDAQQVTKTLAVTCKSIPNQKDAA